MKDPKADQGKVKLELLTMHLGRSLTEVAKISMYGEKKYGRTDSWSQGRDPDRYTGALLRHLFAEGMGEEIDQESGIPHAAAVAWNALVRLDLMIRKQEDLDKSRPQGKVPV